jgi:phosphoserine phosphatase RsbU/P
MIDTTAPHAHRLERLRTLTEVSRALTYATSIDEVLRLTVERAVGLMSADKSLIMLADEDGLLTVRAAFGIDEQRMQELREPLTETLIHRLQGLLGYPAERCFLSVPLVAQGAVIGLLAAVRPDAAETAEDDEWLLSALADQAAVALENARLAEAVLRERDDRIRMIEVQDRAHATLGHELRSPLTTIQAYSSLLLDELFGPLTDRQRESIGRIQASGHHLLSVIESLMDMARVNTGVLTVNCMPIRVAGVVMEAVQLVQPQAAARRQELRTGETDEVVVRADADRLRQVFMNLIDNAIKYTPEGGTVEVGISTVERKDGPMAAVAVSDNGRGMSAEVVAAIFEPYERGDAGTHERGLGLGLFISREIVRMMGGDIEVASEPGSGSTFTVVLPVDDPSAAG